MTNNFFGPVGGVVEGDNATVYQNNYSQNTQSAMQLIEQLEQTLAANCSQKQMEAAKPVLQDLKAAVNGEATIADDGKSWTDRLLHGLALGADLLTISQAPWWSHVVELIQGAVKMLAR